MTDLRMLHDSSMILTGHMRLDYKILGTVGSLEIGFTCPQNLIIGLHRTGSRTTARVRARCGVSATQSTVTP